MKELNNELVKYNELEKHTKGRLEAIEKAQDKALIAQALESDRKQAEMEHEMKLKRLAEAKETLRTIDDRAEKQRQEELMIERLAEQERKRQDDLEDARYMKEQQARITLLKDVYAGRASAIENKSKSISNLRTSRSYIQSIARRRETIFASKNSKRKCRRGGKKSIRKIEEEKKPGRCFRTS